jgi:hypothetical protein
MVARGTCAARRTACSGAAGCASRGGARGAHAAAARQKVNGAPGGSWLRSSQGPPLRWPDGLGETPGFADRPRGRGAIFARGETSRTYTRDERVGMRRVWEAARRNAARVPVARVLVNCPVTMSRGDCPMACCRDFGGIGPATVVPTLQTLDAVPCGMPRRSRPRPRRQWPPRRPDRTRVWQERRKPVRPNGRTGFPAVPRARSPREGFRPEGARPGGAVSAGARLR